MLPAHVFHLAHCGRKWALRQITLHLDHPPTSQHERLHLIITHILLTDWLSVERLKRYSVDVFQRNISQHEQIQAVELHSCKATAQNSVKSQVINGPFKATLSNFWPIRGRKSPKYTQSSDHLGYQVVTVSITSTQEIWCRIKNQNLHRLSLYKWYW